MSILLSSALTLLAVVLVAAGCFAAAFGLYLLALSAAAHFYSERPPQISPTTRLVVLIPAHNEALLIARCVRSVRAQTYPNDLYEIVVVADNCTDDTGANAAAAGAHRVMTRNAPASRGKGQALRWAFDQILTWQSPPDAVVIIDADSIAAPNLLMALVEQREAGAPVVQGRSLLSLEGPRGASLSAISFLLINQVRPRGRAVLRLPYHHLAGNGMLLAKEILLEHPWRAFTSAEDVEYTLTLRVAGVRIAFADRAVLHSPSAPSAQAAAAQQLRWSGGKIHLARVWVPQLVTRAVSERRPWLLFFALGLTVPPLALLAPAIIAGAAINAVFTMVGLVPAWSLLPWLLALGSIPLSVAIGLLAARVPASAYKALVYVPLYIIRAVLTARRMWRFGEGSWVRTERQAAPETVMDQV